jgi:hypothetical protein
MMMRRRCLFRRVFPHLHRRAGADQIAVTKGIIDAANGGLAAIYFVRPDMLEKKHRHTHMLESAVKGLSQKSEADYNRVVWR